MSLGHSHLQGMALQNGRNIGPHCTHHSPSWYQLLGGGYPKPLTVNGPGIDPNPCFTTGWLRVQGSHYGFKGFGV